MTRTTHCARGVYPGLAALAALLLCGGPAAAQTAPPAALAEMNREYQYVWDRLRPTMEAQLHQMARDELGALRETQNSMELSIKEIRGVSTSLQAGPGFQHLGRDRIAIRVPGSGAWELEVEAVVRIKLQLLFVRSTIDVPVRLRIHGLAVAVEARFDTSDPHRPMVQRVDSPQVDFRVEVRSSRWYYDALFRLLNPVGERLARRALVDALAQLTPQLANLQGLPGPVPGDGTPPLVDSGTPVPWDTIITNVEKKLRRQHLPHGTLLETIHDQPSYATILDAYGPAGSGNPGRITQYWDGGDSAIWTGHYLSSQALRYAVTRSPLAQEGVRHAVQGFANLLDVNGSGLLARVAAPEKSLMGAEILRHGTYGRTQLRGQTWVWRQGGHGISRDQYSGAFMGLTLAHDLVPDRWIRGESTRRIVQMLDYIIANRWFIDEDRHAFDGTPQGGFPTFWAGVSLQRLTFLHMGNRVAPGRYDAELQAASPLAATAWLGAWISTFNLQSYYKFNLSHSTHYNFYRLETDPWRWQEMGRALRILMRYVGHHHNAHFDLVHASFDPSLRAAKHSTVRETLRQFLQRSHREVGPAVVDLSKVQYQTYPLPTLTLPGQTPQPQTVTLPTQPIAVPLRKPEGNFLWQRDPFSPATPHGGNPHKETPGIDLTLPYWMAKQQGGI